MKKKEYIELIKDLKYALSKALNDEVIRELGHLTSRAEIAVRDFEEKNKLEIDWDRPFNLECDKGIPLWNNGWAYHAKKKR